MHRLGLPHLLMIACGAAMPLAIAHAGDNTPDDNSRSVRIIEDSGTPPAAKTAPPGAPVQLPPPAATAPPAAPPVNYAALNSSIKAENPAGVSLEIMPGTELPVGTKIVFKISTKKPGYLVLVDVDSTGKLTQIYPNPLSTMRGTTGASNVVKPDRPLTLPDAGSPFAGYEFVAEPPTGVAMVVALLSDQPVQIVDLPDVPASSAGQADAFQQVYETARSLRIVGGEGGEVPRPVNWSIDAKYYAIR